VLECDINEFESRATVIGAPFSPKGLAFAIRKHSKEPWTLLRLINNRALTPLAAGLISFLIHGQSTIMVAGSRGAGKSSLLGAMMLEFPPHQRILTIEDTMELPVWEMQDMGYHIQPMLVQSSLGGYGEKTADDALRVALRLGESAIILGEVRGQKETGTLYEAMRAGTAGSSVMGTIHGNSPKAVRDRVVSDMKIPPTSFSATDIIIVAGVRRPAGASSSMRRVDCISEVVVDENEHIDFHDLMRYSPEVDALMPTDWFFKSQKVKSIADKFSITPEQALQHVWARGKVRHMVTEYARASSKAQVLHARNIIRYNNKYQDILDSMVERSRKEKSELDCRTIVQEWSGWFNETSQFV
jgi:type IV secretory pathway ATPase VirB11/archaellum biosynthesis ATPase